MNLIKVKQSFYDLCKQYNVHDELLFNEDGRPCVLIIKLKYQNTYRDFIVPLRSNISPKAPREQYFNLPPNPNTKPKHHHGIHYIKIFPIHKSFIDKYVIDGDKYYSNILNILNKKEPIIIESCQNYLNECSSGNKHSMTPNIDGIIDVLESLKG